MINTSNRGVRMSFEESVKDFAESLHCLYEEVSEDRGWNTQKLCKVTFDSLPERNKLVMLDVSRQILIQYVRKHRVIEEISKYCSRKDIMSEHKILFEQIKNELFEVLRL